MTRKSKRELERTLEQLSTSTEDVEDLTTDELTMLLLRDAHGHADLTDEQRESAEEEWSNRMQAASDSPGPRP